MTEQAELTRLADEHMGALRLHKDADCHWEIIKRWSYGDFVGYFVQHAGRIHDLGECGELGPFSTHAEATESLAAELQEAIAEERDGVS